MHIAVVRGSYVRSISQHKLTPGHPNLFPIFISDYQALRQSKRAAQDQNSQVARFELDGLHAHQNVARGAETHTLLMVYCIATATGQCAWRSSLLLH